MKAKSYPLALMAAIVLTSVTLAFSQKKAPSTLPQLYTARESIEEAAKLYFADCKETPALAAPDKRRTVRIAYGEVKSKYGAFKAFIQNQALNGKNVKAVEKAVRNDKTYLPALETAMVSYKKKLDGVYNKGSESKPFASPTAGFDPSALITGILNGFVTWIQGDLTRKWEERKKLLEILDKPDYTLGEYEDLEAAPKK